MTQVGAEPRVPNELPPLPAVAQLDGTAVRIAAAALALFARTGFHGTSVRDIGDAVGLRAQNLYAYFTSKEQLLAELVRLGHEEHHRRLRRALLEAGATPADKVRALVRAHVRAHAEYPLLAIVANNEIHVLSPELAAPSQVLREQSRALLAEAVEHGVALGVFDPPHVKITVAAISGMGMRVANWYRPELPFSVDELADVHAELAVRMLCTQRATSMPGARPDPEDRRENAGPGAHRRRR